MGINVILIFAILNNNGLWSQLENINNQIKI